MQLYSRKRTPQYHLDYRGEVDGYHYLDIHDVGTQSIALYRGSYRTPSEALPEGFPDEPQPPIVSSYDESEILRNQSGPSVRNNEHPPR